MEDVSVLREECTLKFEGPAIRNHEMDITALANGLLAFQHTIEQANSALNGKRTLISVKIKGGFHLDTYKTRIKDRPFAEGSRGCHVFLWLDAQSLSIEELRFILPLVIRTFIMQSVAFITSISQDRIKLISPTLINHTYFSEFAT